MAVSKMTRESAITVEQTTSFDSFDFGEPEVITVDIGGEKPLMLKEPTAEELMKIDEITNSKSISEIEATLQTICILHEPEEGKRKISLKEAKKLRPKQLRALGMAIRELLYGSEESGDNTENFQG